MAKRKTLSKSRKLKNALTSLSIAYGSSIKINSSEKELAAAYLYATGCSTSTEKKDYSLLDVQTDTENIENENIVESKKFSRLKAGKTTTTDKFANTSDSFYELDDDLPERIKAVKETIAASSAPDLTNLVLSLVSTK